MTVVDVGVNVPSMVNVELAEKFDDAVTLIPDSMLIATPVFPAPIETLSTSSTTLLPACHERLPDITPFPTVIEPYARVGAALSNVQALMMMNAAPAAGSAFPLHFEVSLNEPGPV